MRKKGGAGVKNRAGNTQEKDRIPSGLCKKISKFPSSSGQSGAEGFKFVLSVLSQAGFPEAARFGEVTVFYHVDKGLKASKHLGPFMSCVAGSRGRMCGRIQEAHLFSNQDVRAHPSNAGLWDTGQHPGGQAGASNTMREAAFGCGIHNHESVAQQSFPDGALDVADCNMACDVTGFEARAHEARM